jgi:hypothetical protein
MKKIIFSLSIILLAVGVLAQNEGFIHDGELTIKTLSKDNSIEGYPYLNDEFVSGSIITVNNLKYIDIPLRYNIYNDEIEFQKGDIVFVLDNPLNYVEITIGSQVFIHSTFGNGASNNTVKYSYFEVLNPKMELLLLKRFGVRFNKSVPNKGYYEAKPAEFKLSPERFYLKFKNDAAQEVVKLKTTLLLFGDKSKDVKVFIKKEKLKLRKETDLISIVEFYNSLI